MKRRDLIKTLGYASPIAAVPVVSLASMNNQTGWLEEFRDRWEVSESYTREVFHAMPEE